MGYMQIPVTSSPYQTFICTIPVDNRNLTLKIQISYNTAWNYWVMTLADPTTGKIILDNIPLITGADIFGQYKYLNLGSAVIVNVGNNLMDIPDSTNLGTDFILIWGDTA